MFDFKGLVSKYSKGMVFASIEEEGHYNVDDGGKYVEGSILSIKLDPAAIVPLNKDDLKFDEGGSYSDDNRKLYCYLRLEKGTEITNVMNDKSIRRYKVLAEKDYSDYDKDLHIYILERVDRDDFDKIPEEFNS